MSIVCPRCGTLSPDGVRFCEKDGFRLIPEDAVPVAAPAANAAPTAVLAGCRCGAGPEAEADGYCTSCGRKWVKPRLSLPRDHGEIVLSAALGGVTDRGLRHEINEDDFTLPACVAEGFAVLVVCDGVSSSDDPQRASAIAAKTAAERLRVWSDEAMTSTSGGETALREAIAAANEAVCALHSSASSAFVSPPATTIVAALVSERSATLGWVGDSRAYWIDREDPAASRLLTHDHSWVNDVVDSGAMSEAEAGRNRLAHAITRCLGQSDDPESNAPTLATFVFPANAGYLMLCTDGLWNYAPDTAQIAALVQEAPQAEGVVGIARSLVAWANAQGGRDNITVALLAVAADSLTI